MGFTYVFQSITYRLTAKSIEKLLILTQASTLTVSPNVSPYWGYAAAARNSDRLNWILGFYLSRDC